MSKVRHFITVDWCDKGNRGIFCDIAGNGYSQEVPWTKEEMYKLLGNFWLILNPESMPLSVEEVKQYNCWRPLAEYRNYFGIAMKNYPIAEMEIKETITNS